MSNISLKRYNVSDITSQFGDYLTEKRLSKISRKNYQSDLRAFLIWNATQDFDNELSVNSLISYKKFLEISKLPVSSINRSLSSLRAYGDLLVKNQVLFSNPARMISNIPQSLGLNTHKLVDQFSKDNALNSHEIEILHEFLQ